jgi:predicted glycogen debranching enzyme
MLLVKDKAVLGNFKESAELEWLETNGLGGWAGSTVSGCHTRRYHGLLMAAIVPPADRMLLLSKLDETLVLDGKRFELGVNDFGDALNPTGFQYLNSFRKEFFPEWTYEVPGIRFIKTVTMLYEENTTMIRYEILRAAEPFTLELLPLIAARGYHQLQNASSNIFWDVEFENGIFHNQPYENAPDIFIAVPGSVYQPRNQWYNHFYYAKEKNRGLDCTEDLFNHGLFTVEMKEGDVLYVLISTENPGGKNAHRLFENERDRRLSLLKTVPGELAIQLTLAADQFIVQRTIPEQANRLAVKLKTVIAGYHWFTDWGRDTMISLPGLCLQTGRLEDAKKIISVFANSVSQGMLPNRFLDQNEPPEYNTADGTLWFFNAVYAYLQVTEDRNFILQEILPVLKNIIEWHFKGTRFGIHVDDDGLLYAGEPGQQLTWMDARVNGWVVTPRMGKPVEIEALWYNALKIFETLLLQNGEMEAADQILKKAEQVKKTFSEIFWFPGGDYCYDVIDETGKPDPSLRPNQIFAISLPFKLLEGEKAAAVLQTVRAKLYTPFGLRSLAPDDPKYIGLYNGDAFKRDSAYHQGTVWSWLLGPFVEAGMKTFGESFKAEALTMIDRFSIHLNENCIGNVSEIFDGDPPHSARGCVAQAWGVAEILRVIKTYSLIRVSG